MHPIGRKEKKNSHLRWMILPEATKNAAVPLPGLVWHCEFTPLTLTEGGSGCANSRLAGIAASQWRVVVRLERFQWKVSVWIHIGNFRLLLHFSFPTVSAHLDVFAVPNEHRAAVWDTDEAQQQPGPQICRRQEQLGDAAAAGGTETTGAPSSGWS